MLFSFTQKIKYISLSEASRITGFAPEYLNLRVRQNKLRAVKIGRNWMTTKDWLEEYFKKSRKYKERQLLLEEQNRIRRKNILNQLLSQVGSAVFKGSVILAIFAVLGFNYLILSGKATPSDVFNFTARIPAEISKVGNALENAISDKLSSGLASANSLFGLFKDKAEKIFAFLINPWIKEEAPVIQPKLTEKETRQIKTVKETVKIVRVEGANTRASDSEYLKFYGVLLSRIMALEARPVAGPTFANNGGGAALSSSVYANPWGMQVSGSGSFTAGISAPSANITNNVLAGRVEIDDANTILDRAVAGDMTFTDAVSGTWTLAQLVGGGGGGLGANLSSLTNDILSNNGSIVLGGTAGTYNERLSLNFDGADDTIIFSSSTGAASLDFGAFSLLTTGNITGNFVLTTGDLDLNGNYLIMDADADTKLRAYTDDIISIDIGGGATGEYLFSATQLDMASNNLTTTGTGTFATMYFGNSTGASGTAANGILTFKGLAAGGINEDLSFNFERDNNAVVLSSSTSVGTMDFSAFNLTTSGTGTFGTLSLGGGSITDSTGTISFGDENLTTTGNITGNFVLTTGDLDLNGNYLIMDADADTKLRAYTDDIISIDIGGGATGEYLFSATQLDMASNNLTTTGTGTFATMYFGNSTGASGTAANGILTFKGLAAGGINEDLSFNFERDNNAVVLSSSTSVGTMDFSAFNLTTTGKISSGSTIVIDGTTNPGTIKESHGILGLGGNVSGGTYNEDLRLNFEGAADTVIFSSSTGAASLDFGAFSTTTTGAGTFGSLVVDTTTLVVNASGYADKVGIGTATPAVALQVNNTDSGKTLLLAGNGLDGNNDATNGIMFTLTHNATNNRQFTLFDSGVVGNASYYGFRFAPYTGVVGALPIIDAVNGTGAAVGNFTIGQSGSLVGIGFDAGSVQANIKDKLHVNGNVRIGNSTAGVDYTLTFDGETNDGVLTWMEDEDYFAFSDDIYMNASENITIGASTGVKLSAASGVLTLAGIGNTINENLLFNFERDTDSVMLSSGTSVGTMDFSAFNLKTTGNITGAIGRFTTGIYDNAGTPVLSIDTGNRYLYDSGGTALSADWNNRYLYASDGTTIQLNHSTAYAISMGGAGTPLSGTFFFGYLAGDSATGANSSNFFGESAGSGATGASSSNFLGYYAGSGATNAFYSNFLGDYAGFNATGAYDSNFLGDYAGSNAADAIYSNFFGYYAGYLAGASSYSNFIGNNAGSAAYASNANFLGYYAGSEATGADNSNFIGNSAGQLTSGASGSNFIGTNAGQLASSANESNFLGSSAGYSASTAAFSNFLGSSAGNGASGATESNFIGYSAGNGAYGASDSNFIGYQAGYEAYNATTSNFIGMGAGYQANSANNSNFIGYQAGYLAASSPYSNFIGYQAGSGAAVCTTANFIGYMAGYNATGAEISNFIGSDAGNGATNAYRSNFFGSRAGYGQTIASHSIFIGENAGNNNNTTENTDFQNNLIIDQSILSTGVARATAAAIRTNALLYGTFADAAANQQLTINVGTLNLNAVSIATDTTTGLKIGTATNQKLGFFNATPVAQQSAVTDLGTALSNLGLRAAGTAYPITTSGAVTMSGGIIASNATTALTIGSGGAGVDYRILFDGETNDGVLTWMEDEDYFAFSDDIYMNASENITIGASTGVKLSAASGVLTLAGIGNTINENLLFNFERDTDSVVLSSGTSVGTMDFSAFNLTTTGKISSGSTIVIDGTTNPGTIKESHGILGLGGNVSGGTYNEDLRLNFEGAADTVIFSSSTGAASLDFSAFTGIYSIGRFTTGIYDNAATPLLSIDTGNRKLYASDGTTTQLDYSLAGAISMGGAGTPLTGSFFFGLDAGDGATGAFFSNFFGYQAGYMATNDDYSNFIGYSAGSGAGVVTNSNFIGTFAGNGATNAGSSNFFGPYAGLDATNAYDSNFLGNNAGSGATDAVDSNFFGTYAGSQATNAGNSNFFGALAGSGATGASHSNFIGYSAGAGATDAGSSNFLGDEAGSGATGSSGSNFFGIYAGWQATDASNSNFIGYNAGTQAYGATFSNFFGYQAGYQANDASYSNFIGMGAGYGQTIADYSVFIGTNAGNNNNGTSNTDFRNNLIIDQSILSTNSPRASAADIQANALIYGTFADAAADQSITFNVASTAMGYASGTLGNIVSVNTTPYNSGGGYTVDDILTLDGGDTNGTVKVISVDEFGGVAEVLLIDAGTGYTVAAFNTTGGTGAGCVIEVTEISSAGTLIAEGTGSVAIGQNVNALTNDNVLVFGKWFSDTTASSFNVGFGQRDFQVTSGNVKFGSGAAGVDYTLTFDGETKDGILTWMEDEDYFAFSDDVVVNSGESLDIDSHTLYVNSSTHKVGVGLTAPGTNFAVAGLAVGGTMTVKVNASGDFYNDGSSLRYKDNVVDLKDDFMKILTVSPKSFTYKSNGVFDIGYIAEDFDSLGLKNLVIYDNLGRPDAIRYDKVALYAIEVLKGQQEVINQIKEFMADEDIKAITSPDIKTSSFRDAMVKLIKETVASMGNLVSDGIAQVKELIADRITAKTARVEKMEMVDQKTGDIYCTWIENGEVKKAKGECSSIAISSDPVILPLPTPDPDNPVIIPTPTTTPDPVSTPVDSGTAVPEDTATPTDPIAPPIDDSSAPGDTSTPAEPASAPAPAEAAPAPAAPVADSAPAPAAPAPATAPSSPASGE